MNRHLNVYKEKHIHLSKKHKGYENELEKTVIDKSGIRLTRNHQKNIPIA